MKTGIAQKLLVAGSIRAKKPASSFSISTAISAMSNYNTTRKESDAFAESAPFFGTKSGFKDAFPEIDTVSVKVDFGHDYYLGKFVCSYDEKSLPGEHINCRNTRCNGGISIGSILRAMVENRQTNYSGTIFCQGHEGSPKGRISYGRCDKSFGVKIQIQFKTTTPNLPR